VDRTQLKEQIVKLGPWHLDIEVVPGLTTRAWYEEAGDVQDPHLGSTHFQNPQPAFRSMLEALYPGGLEGRAMLDCACNCGGYLFWARELGAGRCFGFDVREHWIRQAEFLRAHREDAADIEFRAMDLYELPALGLEPFDLTLFNGIFYHLPEPVGGLRVAADLTREVMMVETATRSGREDGALVAGFESRDELMSGVHGLMWRPTGPLVMERIFKHLGFEDTMVLSWREETQPGWGRLAMLAARTSGLLDAARERAGDQAGAAT
jgi:tRNA (mo5U34)-methyltransferase